MDDSVKHYCGLFGIYPSTLVQLGLMASLTIAQDSAPRLLLVGLHGHRDAARL